MGVLVVIVDGFRAGAGEIVSRGSGDSRPPFRYSAAEFELGVWC